MYKRNELGYEYNALEPYMDKETVDLHYNVHHKGYETKLNALLEKTSVSGEFPTLEALMKNYQKIEDPILRVGIREFGGGLINHNFWWPTLKKDIKVNTESNLYKEIIKTWETFENFKKEFLNETLSLFGSGWVWLAERKIGGLKIIKTFNQDNPWFLGFKPLFGIDVWEHAYYLKHKGNRKEYFEDIWNLINWTYCEELFDKPKQ